MLTALLLLALAAPASAAVEKKAFSVPVRTPDETGAKVSLDTDVYLPDAPRPRGGYPLIEVFHGGGSNKDSTFDAGHARFFAEHGYVALIYSQRGHGASGGLTAVAGPNEMRDLFDVTQWALTQPFGINRHRIGLTGYSQGGLSTNLAQAWARDRDINPYGIRFRVLEPGNTPDSIAKALVPNGVAKLSVGVGLVETYAIGAQAHMSPLMAKWVGTEAADAVYAAGADTCDVSVHDTPTSPTLNDFAARSVGCFADRVDVPVLWSQALDDVIFPPDMAVSMWRRMPDHRENRLYLDMGGHAAPSQLAAVDADKLKLQLKFFDHVLRGRRLSAPRVVYWTRDPAVRVPADAYRYPDKAWSRHTARTWPPQGVTETPMELGAGGTLAPQGDAGSLPLAAAQLDPGSDAVAQAAFSATPLGATPVAPAATGTSSPGLVAGFATPAFPADREVSGPVGLRLRWTPNAPDTQLAAKVYDRAPDGTLTMLARGVTGLRGAIPGQPRTLSFATNDVSVLVHAGHSLLLTVTAGDASFYKAFAGSSAGGVLDAGPASTATLPLR